jgi:hypothetical protein
MTHVRRHCYNCARYSTCSRGAVNPNGPEFPGTDGRSATIYCPKGWIRVKEKPDITDILESI